MLPPLFPLFLFPHPTPPHPTPSTHSPHHTDTHSHTPHTSFTHPQVRWKCSWDSLLAKGWVVLTGELGYSVPPEAVIVGNVPAEVSRRVMGDG